MSNNIQCAVFFLFFKIGHVSVGISILFALHITIT